MPDNEICQSNFHSVSGIYFGNFIEIIFLGKKEFQILCRIMLVGSSYEQG